MNMRHESPLRLAPLLAVLALPGCTHEVRPTDEFGSAVRHMIRVQTYQGYAETPALEGRKAANVLEAYRSDVYKPEEVSPDLLRIQVAD